MRIELNSGGLGGISTISNMQESIDSLLQKSETLVSALQSIRSYTYSMNGGVGILQDAVSNLEARLQAEETKKTSLTSTKTKIGNFVEYVVKVDGQVADTVNKNQEEFYHVNDWAKPSTIFNIIEEWCAKVKQWLDKITYNNSSDKIPVIREVDPDEILKKQKEWYERNAKNGIYIMGAGAAAIGGVEITGSGPSGKVENGKASGSLLSGSIKGNGAFIGFDTSGKLEGE